MDKSLEKVKPIISQVQAIVINTKEDLAPATEVLSQLNKHADALKKDRLALTQPLEDSLKLIRAKYKPTEDALKSAIEHIKGKMGDFQTEQLRIQREEEAKIAAKVESGYIKPETAISKMENVQQVDKKVSTDVGSVSFREEKDFEVIDVSQLPVKYLLPNMVELRIAMKAGLEIPGCKYFTKQVITNRKK